MPFFQNLRQHFSDLLDPPVDRTRYPRSLYGEWEFVEDPSGALIARVYTTPPLEQSFLGPNKEKTARKWVHEHMHLVKKGV